MTVLQKMIDHAWVLRQMGDFNLAVGRQLSGANDMWDG